MISEQLSRKCSTESLFDGRLICRQHLHGYRFSHDPVLLAHFFTPSSNEHILDLGTGCGIIALILAYRWPGLSITALEVQSALVELARANVTLNNFDDRVQVVEGDLKKIASLFPSAGFDRVLCNPPYYQIGAARLNSDLEQAIARHEIMAGLGDVVKAAVWLLAEGGKVDLVYPVERADELQDVLQDNGCIPVRLQEVYSYPKGSCRLVLLEAIKGGGADLKKLPPLYVQPGQGGGYSPEMASFYES